MKYPEGWFICEGLSPRPIRVMPSIVSPWAATNALEVKTPKSILKPWTKRAKNATSPLSLIEGKRGLGRTFSHGKLENNLMEETIKKCKNMKSSDINLKPYPTCTSVHPTLTALEELLIEEPYLALDNIKRVEVKTYNYAVELSNESNFEKPISLKLNIPYLCAVMLVKKTVKVENTETVFLSNKKEHEKIMKLSKKIILNRITDQSVTLGKRKRPALVEIVMKNGEKYQKLVDEPKWRGKENILNKEIEEKFSVLSGKIISEQTKKDIINKVWNIEKVKDVSTLIKSIHA